MESIGPLMATAFRELAFVQAMQTRPPLQRRHPLPRRVAQNQMVLHTKDCLPKSSFESDLLLK
jgi:hypothetical protein